ncbi:hypothetical protein D9756_002228 [Leucocoprinus leucothites]|uniref:RING-type domain-containing protein n=1 Tax=Leucocoprinus leucothites TaxID=201217 RepID=A0A8H5GCN9_9AGAR|nr:hypothetical protein D9756_002228 [Leucoagaricus leucothites]
MSCCICLEDLNSPVSLLCGHVFCHDCLKRAVQAVQPYSTLHACPTCRSHYFITPLDMSTVPPHLRPHVTPSIRRIYLDLPSTSKTDNSPTPTSITPPSELSRTLSTEIARLRAEVEALKHNCSLWRRRAEVHSSATTGLLELSRTARDQIVQTCRERDTIQRNYHKLNHDFQRQQAILRAVVNTSMPQQRFGSPSNPPYSQPPVDQSTSLGQMSVSTPHRRSCPTEERGRKRLRSEDGDDYSAGVTYLNSRPTKISRRVETDSLDESSTSPSRLQVRTETS